MTPLYAPDVALLPEEQRVMAWLRPRSAEALHSWLLANPSAEEAGIRRDLLLEATREPAGREAPRAAPTASPPAGAARPPEADARFTARSRPMPRSAPPRSTPPDAAPPDATPSDATPSDAAPPRAAPPRTAMAHAAPATPAAAPVLVPTPGGAAAPAEAWWSAVPLGFDGPSAADRLAAAIGPGAVAVDLTERLLNRWPPRSQFGKPCCVAFAAAASVELMAANAANGDPPRLSPMFVYSLVRRRGTLPLPDGWDSGATKLRQAAEVLERDGIPREDTWPIGEDADTEPSAAAVSEAAALLRRRVLYEDWPAPRARPAGIARRIHGELLAGRPVAIAVPEFADPRVDGKTDWHTDYVVRTGEVNDPAPWARPKRGMGHAVLIVGFQPAAHEALGGYFLFRNSWGAPWASTAPNGERDDPPYVPAPGYGTISASHIEAHAWEMLSLSA